MTVQGFFIDWDGNTRRTEAPGPPFTCQVDVAKKHVVVVDSHGFSVHECVYFSTLDEVRAADITVNLLPDSENPIPPVKGYFKVWDNGLSCDTYISLAVVNDMGALLAMIQKGQAIIAQHRLKAVRMDYHPDVWVGSEEGAELQGLMVTESTFAFVHTGFIGTEDLTTDQIAQELAEIQARNGTLYAPEFDEETLNELLNNE
ncbi:hypothetical protein ABH908_000021 [Pseudomonas frederiksbergensis]|uniref:hypothetical protein n=1 Tax=Pseudomonas TaxID=286 RepID=UPI003D1C3C5C